MKLAIYGQDKEPEKIARFRLMQQANGNIEVQEVTDLGRFIKVILEITPQGIRRTRHCDGGSLPTESHNDHRVCIVQ